MQGCTPALSLPFFLAVNGGWTMYDLKQDVNQAGNNLPPENAFSSAQDTDQNISTQDQGDVINGDQDDDGRGYKNKYAELSRKHQLMETELKTTRELIDKFKPAQSQNIPIPEWVKSSPESSYSLTHQETEALKISNDYLDQLEETPEGRIQAAQLRNARSSAYQKQENLKINRIIDQRTFESSVKNEMAEVCKQCPELGNPNSTQRTAFMSELDELKSGGYSKNDIVKRAFTYAKANNPALFSSKPSAQERMSTRDDDLRGHTPGTRFDPNNNQPLTKTTLPPQAINLANAFGFSEKEVAEINSRYKQIISKNK